MSEQDNLLEQQLNNALLTNYLSNLTFFSEYDNELYQKIETLSKAIEDGVYEEKYRLEFIKEDGDFDIYDIVNEVYFYDRKPKSLNRKLINQIDFNEKNTIKSLEKPLYEFSGKDLDEKLANEMKTSLQEAKDAIILVRNDIREYTKLFDVKKDKRLKKIEKFVFFGTLLGRHIHSIAEKVNASSYFICEKNLEIFRLSLFVNDYKNLAKNHGVVFSIMDDEKILKEKIHLFLEFNPFSNYILKLSSTGVNEGDYIDSFLSSLVFRKPTTFDYNRMLHIITRNIAQKTNKYKMLQFKNSNNYSFFNKLPVLFIAAGPSFHANIDWIKENQNKFIIATIGASYKTLMRNKIKVDFLFTLDSSYNILDEKQFSSEDTKLLKDTIVLCSSMTPSQIVDRFNKDKVFIYDVIYSYMNAKKALSTYSVGEQSVGILLDMGVKELYLIGLDLALDKETGASHSASADSTTRSYDLANEDLTNRSTFGLNTGIVKIKGNFEDEVFTTSIFNASINALNRVLREKKEEVKVYNLSKNGAYFEEANPLDLESFEVEKLEKLNYNDEKILEFFNENSMKNLSENSIKKIDEEITYIKEVVFKELNSCKEVNFNTYEEFYEKILVFVTITAFKNEETSLLPSIFKNYFSIVLSYLASVFNDKKLKKENIKLKKVTEVFFKRVEILLDEYLKYLEEIKKPKS